MKRRDHQKDTSHSENMSRLPGMLPLPCKKPLQTFLSAVPAPPEHVSSPSPCTLGDNRPEAIPLSSARPEGTRERDPSLLVASGPEQESTQDSSTGQTAKHKRDHHFFVENMPTLPMGLTASSAPKPTWHVLSRLEAAPNPVAKTATAWRPSAPRSLARLKRTRASRAALMGAGLVTLVLIVLFVQSGLIFGLVRMVHLSSHGSLSQQASSQIQSTRSTAPSTPAQRQPSTQPVPTSQPSPPTSATPVPSPTLQPSPTPQQAPSANASQALVRLSQGNPDEYASAREFDTWADSTCSTAALTEVFNAYGRHYRITDVLRVEARLGAITPELGLLNTSGIARTAEQFGFATKWGNNWSLSQVLRNANAGRPVIVAWPSDDTPNGHVVVVTGGDAGHIYVADSSAWDLHRVSRAQFMQWWDGFAAVVTPR